LGLGFPISSIAVDNKRHPRSDHWVNPGQLKVELKRGDKAHVAECDTKEKLLRGLARVIPTLESRRQRNALHDRRMREQMELQAAEYKKRTGKDLQLPGAPPKLLGSGGGGGGGGGGGKKK